MVEINFREEWSEGDLKLVMSHAVKKEVQNKEEKEREKPVPDEIESYILYANAATMKMWSPVFATMLKECSFKEGTSKEVKLPKKKMKDMLELLEVLHPTRKPVTSEYTIKQKCTT